ncbi:MAG: hypothetical protein ACXIT4_07380 [Erythrobacter sp.]
MSAHQLRTYSKSLHEVWFDCIGGRDPRTTNSEQWEELSAANLTGLLKSLVTQHRADPAVGKTALDRRINWLADTLALDPTERTLLQIIARCAVREEWQALLRALPGTGAKAIALPLEPAPFWRVSPIVGAGGVSRRD